MNLFKLISFFLYISAGTVIAQQLTTVSPKTYTTFEIDVAGSVSIGTYLCEFLRGHAF